MPATYEPIATTTLGSPAATITFSSIPATYTDLRLTVFIQDRAPNVRFNSDSTSKYSQTFLSGNGSSATSERLNDTEAVGDWYLYYNPTLVSGNTFVFVTLDIFNYAGSTFKTGLSTTTNDNNGTGHTNLITSLYQSTAAISSIRIGKSGANMVAGTTATLYGIKNA